MVAEDTSRSFTDSRLDIFVSCQTPGISRSFAAKIIEDGHVQINGITILKSGYKLKFDDIVSINFDFKSLLDVPSINLDIIYEDDDCVVINKPVGLLTHSKGGFNPEPTVETWLKMKIPDLQGSRAGIVHRLDRMTSGVMICAKSSMAAKWLQKQFSTRKVKKVYMAIVTGIIQPDHAIIDIPIERNPKRPQTFQTGVNGKPSVTEYVIEEIAGNMSLLKLQPLSGRTHQLRVHLAHMGHPIVGDTLYGGQVSDRLYLHALSLEITLLDRQRQTFVAPLPAEFKQIMRKQHNATDK